MSTPEKTPWRKRLQPYIGALLVIIGLAPPSIAVASGASFTQLQPLFGGLLMVGGGIKLIHMGSTSGRQFWLFVLVATAIPLAVAWLVL